MNTTYQINSDELDINLIQTIKHKFPNQELIIDVYQVESQEIIINEISNQKIIDRIRDIQTNTNIIFPNIKI